MTTEEIRKKIVEKSMRDAAFRASLLKDANAAIEKELGVAVPAGFKVKVVEDSPTVGHLVLPPVPAGGLLSDAQLGGVSGGAGIGYDPSSPYNCIITTVGNPCNSSTPSR